MNGDVINQIVSKYVEDNLAPKPDEVKYIRGKYRELREFLNWMCFRSGSVPRLSANSPVHDLDVIYVVDDPAIQDDPARFMRELMSDLEDVGLTNVASIDPQTHSLTIAYDDGDTDFCMDVVPVIETNELNDFGKPIYIVPEILELNKHNRAARYGDKLRPIEWIKSDPRGYILAARQLRKTDPNFRIAVLLGKSWRHACKMVYRDKFRFKSFHFEQMFYRYFEENPGVGVVDGLVDCIGEISTAIQRPQFKDRADDTRYIDDYVASLTEEEKSLILQLQSRAHDLASQLYGCDTEDEVIELLEALVTVKKESPRLQPAAAAVAMPHQPWGV